MKEQVIVSKTYIGVVDTESNTETGAMTSVQYAPVFKYENPYPIEVEDAKLIRCTSTKDGMDKFHDYLTSVYPKTDYPTKIILYCHNLKWDITFFMNWLMKNEKRMHKIEYRKKNIVLSKNKKYVSPKEFDCLITNMGQVFSIRYRYKHLDITIQDSLKIIPFTLEGACSEKAYNTKFKKIKGEDYDGTLSDEYCLHDVLCLSELIAIQISEGINPTTTVSLASWCLKDYKDKLFHDSPLGKEYQKLRAGNKRALNPNKCFRYYFPRLDDKYDYAEDVNEYEVPSLDAYVRQGYRGGLTYCNPKNANTIYISKWFYEKVKDQPMIKDIIANGNYKIVNYISHLDVHSLYPSKCLKGYQTLHTLPVGKPKVIRGAMSPFLVKDFLDNKKHFMVRFSCRFNIKPNKFPSVQIKCSYYNPNEWLTTSKLVIGDTEFDYPVYLTLTDVEFYDFLDRYDVEDLEIRDHLVFNRVEECEDLFGCYMAYYYDIKSKTPKSQFVKYQSTKSKLNNLTGKFGSSVIASIKVPYVDDEGSIQLKTRQTNEYNEILTKESIYTPLIAWVTAYGRLTLLDEMDRAGDSYVTGDTDSLFVASEKRFIPTLGITDGEINTFDEEHSPEQIAMFCASRQKTYMLLDNKGNLILKVAGMTEEQKKRFAESSTNPFLDFSKGNMTVEGGKLIKKSTPEGAVLVDTDFALSEKEHKITAERVVRSRTKETTKVLGPHNIEERLIFDLKFRKTAIDAYKYLQKNNKYSREALAEMLNINFELPFSFIGTLKSQMR